MAAEVDAAVVLAGLVRRQAPVAELQERMRSQRRERTVGRR
jgi:hypothetical protein